jgi:hypothetical protein
MIPAGAMRRSKELAIRIRETAQGLEFSSSDRHRLSAALLDQVHEHHQAIQLLLENDCVGSAIALLRGMFEAAVRGVWLFRCASDVEIERFKRGRVKQQFGELVADVEGALQVPGSALSRVQRSYWRAMCSYDHAGYLQAVRRITATDIGPNYAEAEEIEVLSFADFCLVLASAAMCTLCDRADVGIRIAEMLGEGGGD